MSLRWRIASLLALVAFGVGAFAAGASYLDTAAQLRASIDDTLRARASAANATRNHEPGGGGDRGPAADAGVGCPTAGALLPASAAQLVSVTGVVVGCIDGGVTLPVTAADLSAASGTVAVRSVRLAGQRYRVLSTAWHEGGVLQIARSTAESDALLGRLRLRLGATVLAAVALAAVLGWAVATRLVRPLSRLRAAAARIASTGELQAPVSISGPGEVGSLAASFSAMVAALARARDQQRQLVSDASHEMRTPLTSLRSNVELLRHLERLPAAERADVLTDVLEDVDELASLLGELVDLASDLSAAEPQEPVDLADLARAVAARAERRTDRRVSVAATEGTVLPGRPRQLERAISNLVDNAVKYSPAGSAIEVTVGAGTVHVLDHGPGIRDDDRDRVFDRFYRAVEARSEPGSGLGLAIVDEIVRGHGGRVFASNRADGPGADIGFAVPIPATARGSAARVH